MIQTIVTFAILYIAAAVDLLVILLIFFARAKTKKEYRDIYIGSVANLKII
jgi:cadmium resistance protein CadD (predicted permease)